MAGGHAPIQNPSLMTARSIGVFAVIVGALMIALAILMTNHWEVMPRPQAITLQSTPPTVYRLNRWTGFIDMCEVDPSTMRNPNSFVGAELTCKGK